MPQMGPMMWFIFPFILMFMFILNTVTLSEEAHEKKLEYLGSEGSKKMLKW